MDKIKILLDSLAREKMNPILTQPVKEGIQNLAFETNKNRARELLLKIQLMNSKIPINHGK